MKEKSTIVLVDDERNILTALGMALERAQAETKGA
jgi:DNA-binding NtrC family response regulator